MLAGKKEERERRKEEGGMEERKKGKKEGERKTGKGGRKDSLLSEYLRNSVTLAHTRYPLSTQNPALDQRKKQGTGRETKD